MTYSPDAAIRLNQLSASEICLILAADPNWSLPAGCKDARRRMADAKRLLNEGLVAQQRGRGGM